MFLVPKATIKDIVSNIETISESFMESVESGKQNPQVCEVQLLILSQCSYGLYSS